MWSAQMSTDTSNKSEGMENVGTGPSHLNSLHQVCLPSAEPKRLPSGNAPRFVVGACSVPRETRDENMDVVVTLPLLGHKLCVPVGPWG
jgi:hypothetical protein